MSEPPEFKVQVYRSNRWVVETVVPDREMAIAEAQRLADTSRIAAVRVIEEIHDDLTGEYRTRTVFKYCTPRLPGSEIPSIPHIARTIWDHRTQNPPGHHSAFGAWMLIQVAIIAAILIAAIVVLIRAIQWVLKFF